MKYIKKHLSHPAVQPFVPLLTFGILGGLNFILAFTLFTTFWKLLHINYLLATSCTYVITAAVQFFGNRKMTFKSSSGNLPLQMVKYGIMLAINYLVTMFVVHVDVAVFHLSPYIGMIAATACTATISFTLFKFWIFRHRLSV